MNQNRNKNSLIIVDSCCELPNDYDFIVPVIKVPFHIQVDNTNYIDDGSINREELLRAMHNSSKSPKSACPSPEAFLEAYEKFSEAKNIFVVTVSSKLSGSYNSAVLAGRILKEKYPEKFVHVFDSEGASATEVNIVLKINECIKNQAVFDEEEIVKDVTSYIKNLNTYFVLQNYETFIKSGRISKVKAIFAGYLKICPIMKGENGVIELASKERGINKALVKLVDLMEENVKDFSDRTLTITHCNAAISINILTLMIKERNLNFKEIIIEKTEGLSTMYAMDDGVILSY